MKTKNIIVERNEYHWISGIIENSRYADPMNQTSLETLKKELKFAKVKEEAEMPEHIVRLNSMVSVETPYGPKTGLQLVAPAEKDIAQDKISILSPMGSALFGYGTGDEVNWIFPKGKGKIRIIEVKNAPKKVEN